MRRIIILLIATALGMAEAIAKDDCSIPMAILVQKQSEAMPTATQTMLESKLRQAVTQSGMEGGAKSAAFCLVASVTESGKEIISGTQPLVTLSVELELSVRNSNTSEQFSAITISLSGAGHNEARAYTAAVSAIEQHKKELHDFLAAAGKKLKDYYDNRTDEIVKQAQSLAARHEYEKAFCLLASVPECSKHYKDVEKALLSVWQDFADYDCAVKVNMARNAWNASQDKEGAELAGAYLSAVDPTSKCYSEAQELAKEIRKQISADIELDRKMQKEALELAKERQKDATELERARIEAGRAIGIAYGENQKATIGIGN